MEKESLEVITSSENTIKIEYESAKFTKRIISKLIDSVFIFLSFIACYIVNGWITHALPQYKEADTSVNVFRENLSDLYKYSSSRNTYENISTYLDNNNDTAYGIRVDLCKLAIDQTLTYINSNSSAENYQIAVDDYKNAALSNYCVDKNGVPLFVEDSTTIVKHNQLANQNSEYYYKRFYREYCLENCETLMLRFFDNYRNSLKVMSNFLFYFQFPVSLVMSLLISILLPQLILKRGRQTIGKSLMKIGVVDGNYLSPKIGRTIAKFSIVAFGEIILSFVTLGIPLIISFSLMAFSKKHQSFAEYMLNLHEIDVQNHKIYFSKYEISVDNFKLEKTPVNFKSKSGLDL